VRGLIALTSGEPAGIAPEITAAAWDYSRRRHGMPFFLIGDAAYLTQRARQAGLPLELIEIAEPEEAAKHFRSALPVLNRPYGKEPRPGEPDKASAAAAKASIEEAVQLAIDQRVSAIVTNPIQKETFYAAGFRHQGHTDFLAHLARERGLAAEPVMMLTAKNLRTVPVTVHIPLKQVFDELTSAAIMAQARVVAKELRRYFGIKEPRLGITGLNPHAGEGGNMGTEEQSIISPAIEQLQREGLHVAGPLPADTAFHEDARARYDAVLCMYHDQALIPVKTLDFHGGVNVTLGLPFIRTSPDHGTALELAGTDKANPRSLVSAIALASKMARRSGA
jgi:4-hydroxythreonine-4-phosphate dehydrogenase